ncbi:hypothetical protein PHLCEN_2v7660 [Hermanssonia centrifuga]|uniref:Uncharacterized protein n=1 Tax=Hermanssonia centrifuga TaxID=98765 RepID=A0A2R6NVY3_9APHY|nr:hypothetical protein PHLCEN_2v7660 [Hermanssonia centrifuga]
MPRPSSSKFSGSLPFIMFDVLEPFIRLEIRLNGRDLGPGHMEFRPPGLQAVPRRLLESSSPRT